jgi:alpha-1,3-mannosyltransferase
LSLLRLFHRIPLVVSTHGGFFHTQRSRAFKQMYFQTVTRQSLGGVEAVVCVSQHDREVFSKIVPPQRIRVIENGANIDGLWNLKKRLQPGLMLGISRLAENKCVHKVLEAMALLKYSYPHLRLEWVGADFASLRLGLERRVIELGLAGRVHFHGAASPEQVYELLERAHLFVSASSYEGFGLSTIEAMSAATVVLVTAVGAHPDVIENGVSGLLMDPKATGLAAHMARALSMPAEQLQQMGEAARAATKRFSWSRIVPQYEQLYREVAGA